MGLSGPPPRSAEPWVWPNPYGPSSGSPLAYVLVQHGVLYLWVLVHHVSAGESVALPPQLFYT
jgi:hypothetical protein